MAPFKSVLDHKDAEAIRAYVIHRAHEDEAMKDSGSSTKSALDH